MRIWISSTALGVVLSLLGGWIVLAFVYGGWLVAWMVKHWVVEPALAIGASLVGGWRLALIVFAGQLAAWWQYRLEQERVRLSARQ